VASIPGVESTGITDNLPMSTNRSWGIVAKGREKQKGVEATFIYVISPGYLGTMGVHLVEGRDIRWDDADKKTAVVIINETVARFLWPGQDPIDRIAVVGGSDARVIGVVADVHESTVEEQAGWQMYVSTSAPQYGPDGAKLVVRSKVPPETLAPQVMRILREINPGQPATEFRPVQRLVDHVVSPRRFFVWLVGAFAGLGLLLASLGIYGVISYSVTQQTQEIGIRMALGASQQRVQLGVLARTLRLAVVGIALGTVASYGIGSLIASLLYGTEATDRVTFLCMIVLLGGVALAAGYLPARRASRIHPMVALRNN
jgi:predicted permease